jgi:4-aminobutyrate aminotransferase
MNEGVAFKLIEGNIITIRPALTITKDHCDMIVTALKKGFESLKL